MGRWFLSFFAVLALMVFGFVQSANAQATRTWVSGVGDDANPCSRTAPCKTFAGAISKTAASGEISVLDPGGFGAVTITKSISIVAASDEGGIAAGGTNGIVINAGANGIVAIKGLIIEGTGTGLNGIRVLSARQVSITDTTIRGFRSGTGTAIDVQPTTDVHLYVENSLLANNLTGMKSSPGVGGVVRGLVSNSQIEMNDAAGISVAGNSVIALNGTDITGNVAGLQITAPGVIQSFQNNRVILNGVDGAPNAVVTGK